MLLKNGNYVNSRWVNYVLFDDSIKNISERIYKVEFGGEIEEVPVTQIPVTKFLVFPGVRLISTIPEQMEYTFDYKEEELYFEIETDVRYMLNLENVAYINHVGNIFWLIVMNNGEEIWFKAFHDNVKNFINNLSK